MENKKDIGQLFKTKLDALDQTPNDKVWASISKELEEKKKKRRIVPFYFYYSGVAILLLLLGFATKSIWLPLFEGSDKIENSTKIDSQTNKITLDVIDSEVQVENSSDSNLNSIANEENQNPNSTKTEAISITSEENQDENGFDSKVNKNANPSSNKSNSNRKDILRTAVANSPKSIKEEKTSNTISRFNNNNKDNSGVSKNGNDNSIVKTKDQAKFLNRTTSEIDEFFKNSTLNSAIDSVEIANSLASEKVQLENKQDSTKVDSLAITRKSKMEIRMAAKKKADSIEAAREKYYVFVHADASAFNHFAKKSYIDPILDNYDTTTEVQINYGIYFGFIKDGKFNFRFGITNTTLSLRTKDVSLLDPKIPAYFQNIEYLTAASTSQIATELGNSKVDLVQNIRLIEIPLEAKYKLRDGVISIEAIGGISTLFMSKTEIKVETSEQLMYLGKVSNGRSASASINLGAGFNYKLTKNLQLNVEPMFKYYFRTFEVSNHPFTLNLQAGLQYNFSQLLRK